MTLDMERIRTVLQAAEAALVDLGACDDDACGVPQCTHALARVRALLAEMDVVASVPPNPGSITVEPMRHYGFACPSCGGDLAVREERVIDGEPTWHMACGAGHEWVMLVDVWRRSGLRLFLVGRHESSR